ncbi:MAG: response regulator, partial [Algicola sp.]|nr:response regulator [Algicola sp.]
MSQILVVEDEQDLSELVVEYLQAADYQTHLIESGHGVVEWVRLNNPALIVLDLMLPGKDGLTLCQEIREFS